MKPSALRMQSVHALVREILPAGKWRSFVRGLAASNLRSAMRLNAIAQVRAVIIASRMRPKSFQPGQPSFINGAASCASRSSTANPARAASTIEASAKGRAKMVCENLTNPPHFSSREGLGSLDSSLRGTHTAWRFGGGKAKEEITIENCDGRAVSPKPLWRARRARPTISPPLSASGGRFHFLRRGGRGRVRLRCQPNPPAFLLRNKNMGWWASSWRRLIEAAPCF